MSNTLLDGSDKENIEANESILSPTDSDIPTDFGKVDSFFDPSIRVRLVPTRRLWWAIAHWAILVSVVLQRILSRPRFNVIPTWSKREEPSVQTPDGRSTVRSCPQSNPSGN